MVANKGRRLFIKRAGYVSLALMIPGTVACHFEPSPEDMTLFDAPLDQIEHDLLQKMGDEFLVSIEKKVDIEELFRMLVSDRKLGSNEELMEYLSELSVTDFENDRIRYLQGWMLSLTEARQCGIYSLIHEPEY